MNLVNIKEHTFIDRGFTDSKAVIVDLGACLGEFTNEFSNKFGGIKKSIMVEANPTNFRSIVSNQDSVRLNKFISSVPGGSEKFLEDPRSPYNGSSLFNYFEGAIEHQIDRITIQEIIENYGIEKIDILKMDIEGSEYEILENIPDIVFGKIDQITVEFHDFIDPNLKQRTESIVNRMVLLGYSVINNGLDYKYGSDYYDTLFYKK